MKMRRKEKRVFGGIGAFAYCSGIVLFILSHWIRVSTPIGEQHHPLENPARLLHSAMMYCVILSLGYLIKSHIIPGLKSKKKQRVKSGLTILFFFILLISTALGMLYIGESEWLSTIAWVHALVGLSVPLMICAHILLVTKSKKS